MSKHEKPDPKEKYKDNGYEPGVFPFKGPGGKHEKPDPEDKDKDDKDKKK
jgi:hypothetical protein